jgi:hypothetical protein
MMSAPARPQFSSCLPEVLRRQVIRTLRRQNYPALAEADVERALSRVPAESQVLLIQAAVDADLDEATAIERLCCLSVCAASVNLADDLADGDCHYLDPRVAPGVSFLLQSWAGALAVRGDVSPAGLEQFWRRLALAAAGQSIEVRTRVWSEELYRQVAQLVAGEQYAGYFRLLWDGTRAEPSATSIGESVGTIAFLHADLVSGDPRFFGMPGSDQLKVLSWCQEFLDTLETSSSRAVLDMVALVRPTFEQHAEIRR